MSMEIKHPLRQVQQRYCIMALLIAAAVAALLMASGFRAFGKGLVLGVLFSVANFNVMAILLPLQLNPGRKKSTMVSLGSILLRYGLMAIPLIIAIKSPQFEISTVVVGLFGVQIAILSDHLWARLQALIEAKH